METETFLNGMKVPMLVFVDCETELPLNPETLADTPDRKFWIMTVEYYNSLQRKHGKSQL